MCNLPDDEIYPEDSPFVINNYALGYQDYFGFRGKERRTEPLAPNNERYMQGWFAARRYEIELNYESKLTRRIPPGLEELLTEWKELVVKNGWKKVIP